ncbi:MAG: hypothetical protein Q7S17_02115 [Xanthobacteraceae bacterium]|nr:hypothetical protein [Xanthobacteraceae bacterium]
MAMINTALDSVEARSGAKIATDGEDLATIYVYSGGASDTHNQNIPAIYLMQDAAVADWRERMIERLVAERAATFRFVEAPKIEKLIMTETGEDGGQRLTATRYGVASRIAVLSIRKSKSNVKTPKTKLVWPKIGKAKPARRKR